MTLQQRQAIDAMLRGGPLDVGGKVAEQRAILHTMVTAVLPPEDVSAAQGELGGVPVVTVQTPGIDPSAGRTLFPRGAVLRPALDRRPRLRPRPSRGRPRRHLGRPRLAPEHPFPAEDAVSAYRALLDEGVPSTRIASSRRGLVAATLVAWRRRVDATRARAAVFSPWALT